MEKRPIPKGGSRGREIERSRGYVIMEWEGDAVTEGKKPKYSTKPAYAFGGAEHATLEEARAWIAAAPTLRRMSISVEAYLPCDATDEQIDEWVEFELNYRGGISGANPLSKHSFEATSVTVDDVRDVF